MPFSISRKMIFQATPAFLLAALVSLSVPGTAAAADAKSRAGKSAVAKKVAGIKRVASPRLRSASAMVVDMRSGDVLYEKKADEVSSIASITKLMTAMVVLDSASSLHEALQVTREDVDRVKGSRSRLPVGSSLSREDALLVALMASENRAASLLARNYPGGEPAFVDAMNRKALELGLVQTRFDDATGLSSGNVSTASELVTMVGAAHRYPLIREFSTKQRATVQVGKRRVVFGNTNSLVRNSRWEISLSKTGYIHEAGKCLVMQTWVQGRPVTMVLLDSWGRQTRIGDANRIRQWMEKLARNKRGGEVSS